MCPKKSILQQRSQLFLTNFCEDIYVRKADCIAKKLLISISLSVDEPSSKDCVLSPYHPISSE